MKDGSKQMKAMTAALFALLAVAHASAASISVVGPVSNPNVNDTFDVDIDVSSISDLYAFQFDLAFDPSLVSAVSITEGAFLPGGGTTFFIPGTIDNVGGTITANADSLIGAIPGVTGSGTLVQIQFTAIAPGTSALTLQNITLLDSTLTDITASATVDNGSVTINGATTSTPEPAAFALLLVGGSLLFLTGWRTRRDLNFQPSVPKDRCSYPVELRVHKTIS